MDGHGVVSHNPGLEVVVVNLEGGVLPYQGILAGLDEKIAFLTLHGGAFSGQGQEILVQLGSQFRIGLLRSRHKAGR